MGRGSGFLCSLNAIYDEDLCNEIWEKYSTSDISAEKLGQEYEMTEGAILRTIRQ